MKTNWNYPTTIWVGENRIQDLGLACKNLKIDKPLFVTDKDLINLKMAKDIILDLFCYRRRGHNEADDPSATQPLMYEKIAKHPSVLKIYEEKLISQNIITQLDSKNFQKEYRDSLEHGSSVVGNLALKPNDDLWFDWSPYMNQKWWQDTNTKFEKGKFTELSEVITTAPNNFSLGRQVKKVFDDRKLMAKGELPINWGFAESMAYASLLSEGYPIRLTGQDVRRGTFSHRHAAIYDSKDGLGHIPLVNVARSSSTTVSYTHLTLPTILLV